MKLRCTSWIVSERTASPVGAPALPQPMLVPVSSADPRSTPSADDPSVVVSATPVLASVDVVVDDCVLDDVLVDAVVVVPSSTDVVLPSSSAEGDEPQAATRTKMPSVGR